MTPWTVVHQAPLSVEFFRQEYWSRLPFPTPGDLPDLGIKPASLTSPALADRFFTTAPPGKYWVLTMLGCLIQFSPVTPLKTLVTSAVSFPFNEGERQEELDSAERKHGKGTKKLI